MLCTGTTETFIFAWGMNMHGQVDGLPSENSIVSPKILPPFLGKTVTAISASRQRTVALVAGREVI